MLIADLGLPIRNAFRVLVYECMVQYKTREDQEWTDRLDVVIPGLAQPPKDIVLKLYTCTGSACTFCHQLFFGGGLPPDRGFACEREQEQGAHHFVSGSMP